MTACNPWEVLIPLSVLALTAHLASLAERGQELFGVTVKADYATSEAAIKLRRSYAGRVWLHTLVAAIVPAVLGEWNLMVGLLAVAWQGLQSGMGWWNAHMEALGQQEDFTKTPELVETSVFAALADYRIIQIAPYLLIIGGCAHSLWTFNRYSGEVLLFIPYAIGLIACVGVRFGVGVGKQSRFSLALALQYFLAVVTLFWGLHNSISLDIPSASSLFRFVFLLMTNHLVFFAFKNGLVGFDPQWESRPGFDHAPVEQFSIREAPRSDERKAP